MTVLTIISKSKLWELSSLLPRRGDDGDNEGYIWLLILFDLGFIVNILLYLILLLGIIKFWLFSSNKTCKQNF